MNKKIISIKILQIRIFEQQSMEGVEREYDEGEYYPTEYGELYPTETALAAAAGASIALLMGATAPVSAILGVGVGLGTLLLRRHQSGSETTDLVARIPAQWIDLHVARMKSGTDWEQWVHTLAARAIAVTLLPTACALDVVTCSAHAALCGVGSLVWLSDKREASLSLDLAVKSLYGLLASPAALLCPDLVSFHFLPPIFDAPVAPSGKLYSGRGAEVRIPESVEEVQEIVRTADHISIAGAQFSQGQQVLPGRDGGVVIDMRQINHVVVDPRSGIATVGGGALWSDLQKVANEHNLAVDVQQASNVFSIGGSIGTNIHGWSHLKGTVAETIVSLTVVDLNGEVRKVYPPDELFRHIVGGFGQFGVVVEAEIQLVKNDLLLEWGVPVAPADYAEFFESKVLGSEEIKMHLYRLSLDPKNLLKTGVAVNYSAAGSGFPGNQSEWYSEPDRGTLFDRILLHLGRRFEWARAWYWSRESERIQGQWATTRNEAMRPPVKAMLANQSRANAEWLQEYFVPKEELAPFIEWLGDKLMEHEVALMNATVRYVVQDTKSALPYASDNRFAVVLFFNQPLSPEGVADTKEWVGEVNDWLGEHGGAFYLPYQQFATREQVERCYPTIHAFREQKEALDPNHKFWSGFAEEYISR